MEIESNSVRVVGQSGSYEGGHAMYTTELCTDDHYAEAAFQAEQNQKGYAFLSARMASASGSADGYWWRGHTYQSGSTGYTYKRVGGSNTELGSGGSAIPIAPSWATGRLTVYGNSISSPSGGYSDSDITTGRYVGFGLMTHDVYWNQTMRADNFDAADV